MRRCCHAHCCCPWPHCCTRRWSTAIWPLTVWPRQQWLFFFSLFLALRWCPCPHCTGVIARIKLSLCLALRRHCCQVGPRSSDWYSAGVCRHCAGVCLHCAGVIASIVLLSLLLALRWHCCPQRVGIFALIAHPLWWHLPFHHHCRLWRPCRIRCHLRPSSVFYCLTPLQQCTCLLPQRCCQSVSR